MADGLRELRAEDAEAVAGLFRATYGEWRPLDADEIRTWLRNEAIRPEWMRVLEVDGSVVGYGDVFVQGDELAFDAAAPGHWEVFYSWAEEEARNAGTSRVRAFFPAGHDLAAVAAARGYASSRSSFVMEIALEEPPAVPPLPSGIEMRTYRPDVDEDPVRVTVNDAFAQDPLFHEASPEVFREFNIATRGFDPALWLLAWDGDELAGVSLNYSERVGEPGLGWVGILGVRAPWRRRGLGNALLRASFAALYDRGLRRVGLGVDTENVAGALRLYERAGMHVVRRVDSWEREV